MRNNRFFALVMLSLLLVTPLAGRAATSPDYGELPALTEVLMLGTRKLVVYLEGATDELVLSQYSFTVPGAGTVMSPRLAEGGASIMLDFAATLRHGQDYTLQLRHLGTGSTVDFPFTAVELIAVGTLTDRVAAQNPAVRILANSLSLAELGQEALLEGRTALIDGYLEIDSLIRSIPSLELPFPEAEEGSDQERINDLVRLAYDQSTSSLRSTRDAVFDQILALERQREDLDFAVARLRIQKDQVTLQLVSALENLVFAHGSLSDQSRLLSAGADIAEMQVRIGRVQYAFDLISARDLELLEITLAENRALGAVITEQLEFLQGEMNLLLGQEYGSALQVRETQDVFLPDAWEQSRMLSSLKDNFALRLLSVDVRMKASALQRQLPGSRDRDMAELEWRSASLRYEDEHRRLALAAVRLASDLERKLAEIETAERRLVLAERGYRFQQLRYELGMLSSAQHAMDSFELLRQQVELEGLQRELLQLKRRLFWFYQGLNP